MATVSQHSGNGTTPVSAHHAIDDTGRVTGGTGGAYTEVTQHTGNAGTPVDTHTGVTGYTEVQAH